MLVETSGVRTYTPGRGNFEAAKRGEQASEPQRKKEQPTEYFGQTDDRELSRAHLLEFQAEHENSFSSFMRG
jgi:hypothetical protein